MVKIGGMLPWGAVLVMFLGTGLGFVGILSLFSGDERQEQAPAITAQSIVLGEHQYMVRCLAFAPDGKTLATGGGFADAPGEIKLWNLVTGTERAILRGNQNGVYAVEFSPDGRTLATASIDQVVTLWDVATGRAVANRPVLVPRSLGIVLAPDGLTLAVARLGADPSSVRLWRVAAEKEPPLVGGSGPIRFSADGRRLALWRLSTQAESGANPAYCQDFAQSETVEELPGAQIWDIPLGGETLFLRGHESFVWALAFSPDARLLASGGFDETIKLWDVRSGRQQATLRGHTDQVSALAFAPDGEVLASASYDKTVRLWDGASGREVATLRGHSSTITCVGYAPDGKGIASSGHDRTVRLWRLARAQ